MTDDDGRLWHVVRYRNNPFPARRSLDQTTERTVVWAVGMPDQPGVDLTPFEDYLARAAVVADVSLEGVAAEQRPEMALPRDLTRFLADVAFDLDAFLAAIDARHRGASVTTASAASVLAALLTGRGGGIQTGNATSLLQSAALFVAAASSPDARAAVNLALVAIADVDGRYGALCRALAAVNQRDLLATLYVGSGLARLGVGNLGAVLSGDGFCPHELRLAYEAAGGRWSDLAHLDGRDDLDVLSRTFESSTDLQLARRLSALLADATAPLATIAAEPLGAIRLAACVARFPVFLAGSERAAGPGLVGGRYAAPLRSLDAMADALRLAEQAARQPVPTATDLLAFARAFVDGPAMPLELALSRAQTALRKAEPVLGPDRTSDVRARLAAAEQSAQRVLDEWDRAWTNLVAADVEGFLSQGRQGWQMSKQWATQSAASPRWLLVFDGLRYDLWKAILAPTLQEAGWQLPDDDVSFAYLPSITAISRRTLIGGSRAAPGQAEESGARSLAERASTTLTYGVRTEQFGDDREEVAGWNVRVFSWPDKLVHTDLADLGTLAAQLEGWTREALLPWLENNVGKDVRLAVSTDHGFAALAAQDSLAVSAAEGDDRNAPRVVQADSAQALVDAVPVTDGPRRVLVARSRRWFRVPGGQFHHFAHGGCTLHEVVVPFAELTPVRVGAAVLTLEGLPDGLTIDEGATERLSFTVKVTGGADMFPTVEVVGLRKLVQRQIALGTEVPIVLDVMGEEGLKQILVRVQSGRDRNQRHVRVTVRLGKIKRQALDFDV